MKPNLCQSLPGFTIVLVMSGLLLMPAARASAQVWTSTNLLGNWTSVAMSADGSKIAAASYLGGIYTSTNGGTNWESAGMPEPGRPVLAASANGSNLVAAFFDGHIYTSSNWGANSNWVQSGAPANYWNCLAASADGTRLVAGAFPGLIYSSTNSGETWTGLTAPWDFWQSAASSASGSNLLVASHFGYIYGSTNAGNTWNELAVAVGGTNIIASDRLYLSVVYTNLNPTATDTNLFITNKFNPVLTIPALAVSTNTIGASDSLGIDLTGINATGTNVMTVAFSVNEQGSNAFAANPLITGSLGRVGGAGPSGVTEPLVTRLAIPDGTGLFNTNGAVNTNLVSVLNTNVSGITLFVTNVLNLEVAIGNLPQSWSDVASSADGSRLAAACAVGLSYTNVGSTYTNAGIIYTNAGFAYTNGGLVYTSDNSGATWTAADLPGTNWSAVTISADGSHLAAVAGGGALYTSSDGGSTWVVANVPAANWSDVALSGDGSVQVVAAYGGVLYFDPQLVALLVPQIVSFSHAAGATTVYFTTLNGATYTLCFTNSSGLGACLTHWPVAASLTGDGGTDHLTDTNSRPCSFYRVGAHR